MINLKNIISNSINGKNLSRKTCLDILNYDNDKILELINSVFQIRKYFKGKKVHIQILTNAKSGNCSENCKYCAQSCISKANIDKYPLVSENKMIEDAKIGEKNGAKRHCLGLSSIKFTDKQINEICDKFKKLRENSKLDICCSIGFLTREQAIKLKNSGVNRINHNLNTGKNFYKNICTTHKYSDRIKNIKLLKEVGFEICSGGIIGMGESKNDIVDMLQDLRKLQPKSVPINFLLPIKGTPFENIINELNPHFCLKVLCLTRILLPTQDIRVAAGREVYFGALQPLIFYIANSIFASGYLTSSGQNIKDAIELIKSSGFEFEIE